jgi:radical SAM protein with 4Fe4S-binding SPASM domain
MLTDVSPPPGLLLHAQVEVTWRCNWRCVHCYQDDHTVERLTAPALRRLFGELAQAGALHVVITGGEPLVHPDIFEILASAREAGMVITLYTNGHKVDRAMARELGRLIGVAELSVLAGDDAIHDRLSKVRGSSRRMWQAVDNLLEEGVSVALKTPVLRPALGTLRSIEARALVRGVPWTADPEISMSYAGQSYPLEYRMTPQETARFYADFPQFSREAGFNLDPGRRDGMCLAGRNYVFIDALGNAYPCLNFKSADDVLASRRLSSPARLGNVLQQPFAEIWGDNPFVRAIRTVRRSDFTACGACHTDGSCSPCMALNYVEHADILTTSSRVEALHGAMAAGVDPGHRTRLPVTPK